MPSSSRKGAFRTDIEGLRGIAVLAVVFFHAGLKWLSGGFVGVDVFFVISGYLIGAHIYADTSRGRFSIAEFYRKRAKRILPALLVLVAVACIVAWFVLLPSELVYFARFCMPAVLSYANLSAAHQISYFQPAAAQNVWLMTWSLGVEEQFYLFFPLLMLALGARSRKLVLGALGIIVVVSFVACVLVSYHTPQRAFYLLPYRAWELILGAALAVGESHVGNWLSGRSRWMSQLTSALGLVLILASCFAYNTNTVFPGVAAAAPVLGAVLLIASPAGWINSEILSWAPLRFMGRISYSLYLWHWPMLAFVRTVRPDALPVSTACMIVLLAIPVAWLSYRFVEQPFRNSKTPRPKLLLRYALCIGIAVLPPILFKEANGLPQRFPRLPQALLELKPRLSPCVADADMSKPDLAEPCFSTSDQTPAIALIGDSHAEVLNPVVKEVAERHGYRAYILEKLGCAPLVDVTYNFGAGKPNLPQSDCLAFNQRVLSAVIHNPHIQIVALVAYWSVPELKDVRTVPGLKEARYMKAGEVELPGMAESSNNLAAGLEDELEQLQQAHKQIILFSDDPIFDFDPMLRVQMERIPIRSLLAWGRLPSGVPREATGIAHAGLGQEAPVDAFLEKIAQEHNARFINLQTNLCNDVECRYMLNNQLLYKDDNHLTDDGARVALGGTAIFPD